MSYYQYNKNEILKKYMIDKIIEKVKKKQQNIIKKMQIY